MNLKRCIGLSQILEEHKAENKFSAIKCLTFLILKISPYFCKNSKNVPFYVTMQASVAQQVARQSHNHKHKRQSDLKVVSSILTRGRSFLYRIVNSKTCMNSRNLTFCTVLCLVHTPKLLLLAQIAVIKLPNDLFHSTLKNHIFRIQDFFAASVAQQVARQSHNHKHKRQSDLKVVSSILTRGSILNIVKYVKFPLNTSFQRVLIVEVGRFAQFLFSTHF